MISWFGAAFPALSRLLVLAMLSLAPAAADAAGPALQLIGADDEALDLSLGELEALPQTTVATDAIRLVVDGKPQPPFEYDARPNTPEGEATSSATLLIYSGVPDPPWPLTADDLGQLEALAAQLATH